MNENKASVLNLGKNHAHTVLKLSIPSIMEQMVFSLFAICDTAQVGALGAEASAAVGILAPFSWLLGGIMSAVTTGFSVITAHSIGENDMAKASKSANKSIWTSLSMGTVITVICVLLSSKIPIWMGADPSIRRMSTVYLTIYSISFVVNMAGTACSSTLRCTGETKVPLVINTFAIIVNVILNALFIFPSKDITVFGMEIHIWGADKGVGGAAFATLVSIIISTAFLFLAVLKNKKGIAISVNEILTPGKDKEIYKKAFFIGMPIFLERLTINLGQMLYMRCISTMGTASVAAHHLAVQAESFSYMPVSGIQIAVQTLMSQSMGAKRFDDGEKFAKFSGKIGFIYGVLAGVIMFFFGRPIMSIFISDENIIKIGASLLKIVAFGEAVQALDIVYSGCLRGIGDTKRPFYIGLTGIWGIRIVGCLICTFVLNLKIHAAWVIMLADMCFRGIITPICFKREFKKLRKQSDIQTAHIC